MQPKVSAIIPNYNHAKFLVQRVESVLGQTFGSFEVICLDDASSDGSPEILEHYRENPRVRLILNSTNSGSPFKQWNLGASQANGEYLWFAESDDYADKDLLATLAPILEARPEVGLAYCASRYVHENGELGAITPGNSKNFDESRFAHDFINNGRSECSHQLYFRSTIPNASAVLVRKSAFLAAGGAEESMRLCGDWFTWVKVLQGSDLAYVSKPLNYFRVPHPGSQRKKATFLHSPVHEWLRVMDYIRERLSVPQEVLRESKFYLAQLWLEYLWRAELNRNSLREIGMSFRLAQAYDCLFATRVLAVPLRQLVRVVSQRRA